MARSPRSGPGGRWSLPEPGIDLPGAPEFVPDVAGWRGESMPDPPAEGDPARVVPDRVDEVLSTSNAHSDERIKVPFDARARTPGLWLVDTRDPTNDVRQLAAGE